MKNGMIVGRDGNRRWYKNGKLHREDGPAVEWAGSKYWYKDDKLHRENGPACEYASGSKYWWYFGHKAKSEEQFYDLRWRTEILLKEKFK